MKDRPFSFQPGLSPPFIVTGAWHGRHSPCLKTILHPQIPVGKIGPVMVMAITRPYPYR